MRKRRFKKLAMLINGFIASLFVVPGIISICTDINGDVKSYLPAYAGDEKPFYYAEFYDTIFASPNNSSDIVYAKIQAKAKTECTITVEYQTYSVNAIESIDYVGSKNTEEFKFSNEGEEVRDIAFKSLLTNDTKEVISTVIHGQYQYWKPDACKAEDGGYYGRHFRVKITQITVIEGTTTKTITPESDTVYKNSQFSCFVYLPYQYRVQADFNYNNSRQFGGEKNIAYYTAIRDRVEGGDSDTICDGVRELDGKKNWWSWDKSSYEGGSEFVASSDTDTWALINTNSAKAYATVMAGSIDTAGFHSNSKIHFFWGNEEFMKDHFTKFGETKQNDWNKDYEGLDKYLGMYFKVDPEATGGYRLNGAAVNYLVEGKNPNSKEDKLLNVPDGPKYLNSDRKTINYRLGSPGRYYLGSEGDLYSTTFFRIYPYNGKISVGFAMYNSNKEYDVEGRDIYSSIIIVDDTAPYIKSNYAEYDKNGNINIYVRFNEAVYSLKEKSFIVSVNDVTYQARYKYGNMSDTLVYQIPAEQVERNHQKITSIKYTLPDKDIADLAWQLDKYGTGSNNLLPTTETEKELTATIIGDEIDLSIPHLGVDVDESRIYQNTYDIILSANSTTQSKYFTRGTVYYTWDTDPSDWTGEKAQNPANYQYSHVLTEEEKGSFPITLANVTAGKYYLHTLAVPANTGRTKTTDYRTFGPYYFDNNNFPSSLAISTEAGEESTLKTKYLNLEIDKKTLPEGVDGSPLDTVDLIVTLKDQLGQDIVETRRIVEDGAIVTGLEDKVVKKTETGYTYISNVDTTKSIPIDPIINKYLSSTVSRVDAKAHFIIVDKAGNTTVTNEIDLFYDTRDTFETTTTFPAGYVEQETLEGIAYKVYKYDTAGEIEFEITDSDIKKYVTENGATFSVTINGEKYEALAGETSLSFTLGSGIYNVVPYITGGTPTVDLVSDNIYFCLSKGLKDTTANKAKTEEDLVLNNETYQLNDVKYYYYNDATKSVVSMNYGATINPSTGKYEGGNAYPTFSSSDAAKQYVKYMERQDLYLVEVTDLIANALNTGSGSTTYVKAPGETTWAQPGQLWVRYKKNTWTTSSASDPYSWAFYFYQNSGKVSNGINTTTLSPLLNETLNTITNRIVSNGDTCYLVEQNTLSPTTNAPYLRPAQMHAVAESATTTMCGTPYVSTLKFAGDKSIYKNKVEVLGHEYPLATNMILSVSNTTSLYYHYYGSETPGEGSIEWHKLNAQDGDILGRLFGDRGIYSITEYDENGVSTFNVYIDHAQPTITVYFNDNSDDPWTLPDDSETTYFSPRKFTITSLTDTDDLAYVAVFSYPYRNLLNVYYAKDFSGNNKVTLTNGNYYVQVGDRSGNIMTYTVVTSETEFVLEAKENSAKTGVIVKVSNRDDKEIYSYEVYINGVLKYTTFQAEAFYRDTGIYRIVVTDIFGNTQTKTVIHEAPTPEITWYYYVDDDTPVVYDPDHISRMKVITDETNPRISYVHSSARVRALFIDNNESADVMFEITGITKDDYSYNEFRNILTFNTLKSWTLRVWYSSSPESDRLYFFSVDNSAPGFSASFVGNAYSPVVVYDEGGNVVSTSSFDIINWDKYPNLGDVITLDYLDYLVEGNTSLPFENGDMISGIQITMRVSDETGVKSVSATKDGTEIKNLKYDKASGTILLSGYGEFVVTAVDELNNVSTFTFKNIETGLASGFVDDQTEAIKENVTNYAHESLTVKTFATGSQLILVKYGDESFTYELNYDGSVLTFGRYFRFEYREIDITKEPPVETITPYADYVQTIGYSLVLDDVLRNRWYPVITTTKFTIEASFDAAGNISYKISLVDDDILVETLFSIGKGKLPSHYKVGLSQKVSTITIYSGDEEIEEGTSFYINVAKTLTIDTENTDEDIINVKYSFSPLSISKEYTTIYNGSTWSSFVGEEKGYYQIIVTNKYNNTKTYNLKKIDTFGFVIIIHVLDGSEVPYEDQRHEAYSNHSIRLIIYSDAVTFRVNGEERGGIYEHDATILTLEREGQFNVLAVGNNGIVERFFFEILNDETFVYQDSWITGFNEKALLANESYTNTKCTVHPEKGEGVIYIDVSINGELHKLYDAIDAQPQLKQETLEEVMTHCGNGTYVVGFRNRYGDLVKKAIYYSSTPSIILDRKTTNDPNTFYSYDLYTALNRGFYSNYVLRFSTESRKYIFKINGEEYSLDEPRILEFSNMGGTGSFSYEVTFLDEYGNDIKFNAILYRQDVVIDVSKMNVVNISNEAYTRDDIIVNFDSNLNGIVSINNNDPQRYVSGFAFYGDGKYTFTVSDVAGNRAVYTINHKSVNHYSLTDPGNNDAEVITNGVVNYSSVNFTSYDECYIRYVFKDGKLLSDYSSHTFNSTGHWELLIEDAVGNQTYESFYILNNDLAEFNYKTPYEYKVTEVWKVESEESRTLLPITGENITLNENGSYVVVVTSTKTTSSFNFTVGIDDTPPSAALVGAENGGVTARDVHLTGLRAGDVIKVYKNGELIETTTVGISANSPVITSSGKYRIEVTNIQGVTAEYEFTRKPIASASASVFIVVTCVIAMAGLTFGLIYHTKLKTDE